MSNETNAPRRVLELAIHSRKDQIKDLELRIEKHVSGLCEARNNLINAKGDLYQLEQAISQLD